MGVPNDNIVTGYKEGTPRILLLSSVSARELILEAEKELGPIP
jgi:hypothetical protein